MEKKFQTRFRRSLLHWYRKHKRDLPWRNTKDPYAIWVSEIMLQQTQVQTVIPYYEKFLSRFPTVKKLARAPEEEVLSLWSGLGYYRRAKLLHRGAQTLTRDFKGHLPAEADRLGQLPGIGPYTAGAIASIAFSQATPLVDGNVTRVLSRVFALKGHGKDSKLQKKIWALARELLSPDHPGDFNQGLMELGATLCRVRLPSCERCPLQGFCLAYQKNCPEVFPESPPAKKTLRLHRTVGVCRYGDEILLVKRKKPRWFQGLWELPHEYLEKTDLSPRSLQEFLKDSLGVCLQNPLALKPTTHHITHHRIHSYAWQGQILGRLRPNHHYVILKFFKISELVGAALPNFDRKVLQAGGFILRKNLQGGQL